MMRRFLFGISALAIVFLVSSQAEAGVVVSDDNGVVRYTNFDTGGGGAGHGILPDFNALASDDWYIWISSPDLSQPPVIAQDFFHLNTDVGFNTDTPGLVQFDNIQVGLTTVSVDIEYAWNEVDQTVTTTANLSVNRNTFIPGLAATEIRLYNLFDYDSLDGAGIESVSRSGSTFTFTDSNYSTDDYLVTRQSTDSTLSLENASVPGDGTNLTSSPTGNATGAFQWNFSFTGIGTSTGSGSTVSFAAVPEPSSLLYATMFGLVAMGRRRRRA